MYMLSCVRLCVGIVHVEHTRTLFRGCKTCLVSLAVGVVVGVVVPSARDVFVVVVIIVVWCSW
jgi:hypothetical protein